MAGASNWRRRVTDFCAILSCVALSVQAVTAVVEAIVGTR